MIALFWIHVSALQYNLLIPLVYFNEISWKLNYENDIYLACWVVPICYSHNEMCSSAVKVLYSTRYSNTVSSQHSLQYDKTVVVGVFCRFFCVLYWTVQHTVERCESNLSTGVVLYCTYSTADTYSSTPVPAHLFQYKYSTQYFEHHNILFHR